MIRAVERFGGTNLVYEKASILKKARLMDSGKRKKQGWSGGKENRNTIGLWYVASPLLVGV